MLQLHIFPTCTSFYNIRYRNTAPIMVRLLLKFLYGVEIPNQKEENYIEFINKIREAFILEERPGWQSLIISKYSCLQPRKHNAAFCLYVPQPHTTIRTYVRTYSQIMQRQKSYMVQLIIKCKILKLFD
jgi:hypothetical protein